GKEIVGRLPSDDGKSTARALAEPGASVATGAFGQCAFQNGIGSGQFVVSHRSVRLLSAECQSGVGFRTHFWQRAQEGDLRPDLVVALLSGPGRHAGVFDAMPDDPEELAIPPISDPVFEPRRRRRHRKHDRRLEKAGRAVAGRATGCEMAGTTPD